MFCPLAKQSWLVHASQMAPRQPAGLDTVTVQGQPPPGVLLSSLGINSLPFHQAQGRSPENRVPFVCAADSVPLVAEASDLILEGGAPHTLASPADVQILLFHLRATTGSYFLPSSIHPPGTC